MQRFQTGVIAALALALASCATVVDSPPLRQYEQEEGAFRGRWWSYFDRGVWLSKNGYLEEAEADFRTALRGRSRDAWSARTYGLHFTEYFPNRELGVLLYEQGRIEEAEQYLGRSLEQVDTARAHHYSDRVLRAKIERGIIRDDSPPVVAAEADTLTPSRRIPLRIAARDEVAVAEVRVDGRRLYQRSSRPEAAFLETVDLDEGEHRIAVEAVDLSDRVTTEEVTVRVDTTAPTIAVMEPGPESVTDAASVTLRVAAIDNFDMDSLTLDGQPFGTAVGNRRIDGSTTLSLQPGENRFVLAARDAAGNENRSVVRVYRGDREAAATKLWWLQHHTPERLKTASASGPAALAAVLASAYTATPDPLRIELTFPDIPDDTVYPRNEIPVIGRVTAATPLRELTVGGAPVAELADVPAGYFEFERRVPLARGENRVEVAAVAEEAPPAREEFTVNADFLLPDNPEFKMPLAIVAAYDMDEAESEALRSRLELQVTALNRFNIVDRQMLEEMLTEQQLSTDLGNPNYALQLGNAVPAQAFVVAFAREWKDGYTVEARVIGTETGTVLERPDAFFPELDALAAVDAGMEEIAAQLRDIFPRLTGRVLVAQDPVVAADYSQADGVRPNTYMLILREGDDALYDGDRLIIEGTPKLVGRARITQVTATATRGQVIMVEEGEAIEQDYFTLTW